MLRSLSIKNYLLIDFIELDFDKGFSVITGETGAGKSIILGAISLLMGKRAEAVIMPDKDAKCIIEGCFDISGLGLERFFGEQDIDFDNYTIIRREILSNGKSRAFINDSQVNLSVLKLITDKLIDLHSQHENLAISMPEYRLQIVDSVSDTQNKYLQYIENYNKLNNLRQQLKSAYSELEKARKDIDYYNFQVEQIDSAKLESDNELEELESRSKLLENAEEIKVNISNSLNLLDGNEISIESQLKELKGSLNKIHKAYLSADEIIVRIESILIEIRDISHTLSDDIEKAESNPELLSKITSRIDLLNTLLIKHNVKNIEELKEKRLEYYSYIQNTEDVEKKIETLKSEEEKQYNDTVKLAKELNAQRSGSFSKIENHITSLLVELGINHAVFKIENNISDEISVYGFDNINFLFSANKSIPPQLLEKVASGGEFSRLMLALKSLIAESSSISTMVFDEIDTGVSGEIASKMGKIMKKLSEKFQVISITHLPQVAALGENHYKVFKEVLNNRSVTKIKKLSDDERVFEIASMISGESLSPQAIENAKILIKNN